MEIFNCGHDGFSPDRYRMWKTLPTNDDLKIPSQETKPMKGCTVVFLFSPSPTSVTIASPNVSIQPVSA